MRGFTHINKIILENKQIIEVYEFLQYAGKRNMEAVALFAGSETNSTFQIKESIVPNQTGYSLESGLMYAVGGDELHRLNVWLYENNMTLIAQIHTHPQRAYHSKADDRFPIVDTIGGISIVVPYFARGPVDLFDWAIYRLSLNKTWDLLSDMEIEYLFRIV